MKAVVKKNSELTYFETLLKKIITLQKNFKSRLNLKLFIQLDTSMLHMAIKLKKIY